MKPHPTLGIMVRSDGMVLIPKNGKHPEHWTYGNLNKKGYRRVVINRIHYKVHRLVAETFIENADNKPQVDHIDRNKSNNNISNLRWVTNRENSVNRHNNLPIGKRTVDYDNKKEYNKFFMREWREKRKLKETRCD
jgi:hypothetical protein